MNKSTLKTLNTISKLSKQSKKEHSNTIELIANSYIQHLLSPKFHHRYRENKPHHKPD